MEGITLLKEARAAGLAVQAEGLTLVVRGPRSAEALALQLLAHKPEVLEELEREARGREALHNRLCKGQRWLKETYDKYCETDKMTERMRERFLEGLDLFEHLENLLRFTYHWRGCALGPGRQCDDDSPVVCDVCERNRPGRGEHEH